MSSTTLGPLTAEICWRVWGTPANFNGFRVLAALLHGTRVVGISQSGATKLYTLERSLLSPIALLGLVFLATMKVLANQMCHQSRK